MAASGNGGLGGHSQAAPTLSSCLLTNNVLQAHYKYYHDSYRFHHHHSSTSSNNQAASTADSDASSAPRCPSVNSITCHIPGCPTCENNVEPHFHSHVPEYNPCFLDRNYSPSPSISPVLSPRKFGEISLKALPLQDNDVSEFKLLVSSSPLSIASASVSLTPSSNKSLSLFNVWSHSNTSCNSPRNSPRSTKSGCSVRSHSSELPSNSVSLTSATTGSSCNGVVTNQLETPVSIAPPKHHFRSPVDSITYGVRVSIDKSLYRINEHQELLRRVIGIVVDNSETSRNAVLWARNNYIKFESDIVVLITVWLPRQKQQLIAGAGGTMPCKSYAHRAKLLNKHAVSDAKKLVGSFYKEYLYGCDVYPLILPLDSDTTNRGDNDNDSANMDVFSPPNGRRGDFGGSPGSAWYRSHTKSAIARTLCRATRTLNAGHLIVGCAHSHAYQGTSVITTSNTVATNVVGRKTNSSGNYSTSDYENVSKIKKRFRSSKTKKVISCSNEKNENEKLNNKQIVQDVNLVNGSSTPNDELDETNAEVSPDNAFRICGASGKVNILSRHGSESTLCQPKKISSSFSTPSLNLGKKSRLGFWSKSNNNITEYGLDSNNDVIPNSNGPSKALSNSAYSSTAAAIRRLVRGSISHYLMNNILSTCNVVLVKTHKQVGDTVNATIASSRPVVLL